MSEKYCFVGVEYTNWPSQQKGKVHFTEDGEVTLCGKAVEYMRGWRTREAYPTCLYCKGLLIKRLMETPKVR